MQSACLKGATSRLMHRSNRHRYSITSSARARSAAEMSIPRALILLRHKRRRFDCRVQQGQRERFRAMATISLRRIVAIEFGM